MTRLSDVISAVALVSLAACGSSNSGSGATGPSSVQNPAPVAPPTVARSVEQFEMLAAGASTGTLDSAENPPQSVKIMDTQSGDGLITVQIGTKLYELEGAEDNGQPIFSNKPPGEKVEVSQISKQDAAALALIGSDDGTSSGIMGYSILGAPTNPSDVNALTAAGVTATFVGSSNLVATHQKGFRDSAEGDLTLNVDFANRTFDGSMDLTSSEAGVANFDITDVNAAILNGKIAGRNMMADVSVLKGDPNFFPNGANQLGLDVLSTGRLKGEFYGPNAVEAGGSFNFTGKEPTAFSGGTRSTIVVQGGFLGKR